MTLHCSICGKHFREEDEIRGEMDAFWHQLGSRVHFSVTKPHNVVAATLRHIACEESED